MHSFLGFNEASKCFNAGVDAADAAADPNRLKAVENFLAPIPVQRPEHDHYYPNASPGGLRHAIRCPFIEVSTSAKM